MDVYVLGVFCDMCLNTHNTSISGFRNLIFIIPYSQEYRVSFAFTHILLRAFVLYTHFVAITPHLELG